MLQIIYLDIKENTNQGGERFSDEVDVPDILNQIKSGITDKKQHHSCGQYNGQSEFDQCYLLNKTRIHELIREPMNYSKKTHSGNRSQT